MTVWTAVCALRFLVLLLSWPEKTFNEFPCIYLFAKELPVHWQWKWYKKPDCGHLGIVFGKIVLNAILAPQLLKKVLNLRQFQNNEKFIKKFHQFHDTSFNHSVPWKSPSFIRIGNCFSSSFPFNLNFMMIGKQKAITADLYPLKSLVAYEIVPKGAPF